MHIHTIIIITINDDDKDEDESYTTKGDISSISTLEALSSPWTSADSVFPSFICLIRPFALPFHIQQPTDHSNS